MEIPFQTWKLLIEQPLDIRVALANRTQEEITSSEEFYQKEFDLNRIFFLEDNVFKVENTIFDQV